MIVPSINFLIFAAVSALAFNLVRAAWWRQAVLLITNVAFLLSFSQSVTAFLPFAGFLALGFVAQRLTRDGGAPRLFIALLVLTLTAFFWLKRYSFIPSAAYLPFPYLLVGLSYVFFRVVHLIIDSHQKSLGSHVSPISYLNYTLNFTSLTSGPIQRYQDYHRAEVERLPLNLKIAGVALERIIVGYFKVALVSMLLSLVHQHALAALGSGGSVWTRVWAGVPVAAVYPVYLYFNFAGYVDVVIGVARFFRIELPENFDRPFSAENFISFWSRWHITLSEWLKTYVFNPLMMASLARNPDPRIAPYFGVGAFFVTFFLVGLWHGQTSEFLFFGFLQGGGVAANKLYQIWMQQRLGRKGYAALSARPLYRACSRGLTFTWFTFTLLWFWSNWAQIGTLSAALGPVGLVLVWAIILVGATLILSAIEMSRAALLNIRWGEAPLVYSRYLRTSWDTALVAITTTTVTLLNSPAPDIVYKSF